MKKIIFISFFLASLVAHSQTDELSQNEKAILRGERGGIYRDFNDKFGYFNDGFNIAEDKNRFSFSYHMGSKFEDPMSNQTLEVAYMKKLSQAWLVLNARKTRAKFDSISSGQKSLSSNPEAEGNITRASDIQSLMLLGGGIGYRFNSFKDRFYETISATLNYATNHDEVTGKNYKGFALVTDFGIHYRSAKDFFYGGKFSYYLVELQREKDELTSYKERSMNLSFLTFGFEIGYFY